MKQSELTKMQRALNDYFATLASVSRLGDNLATHYNKKEAFETMRKEFAGAIIKLADEQQEHNNHNYLPDHALGVMINECRSALETENFDAMQRAIDNIELQIVMVLYWTNGPTYALDKYLGAKD